jgi:hypothetical protein
MSEERILTKHPQGKTGKNITKQTYETLKKAILFTLRNKKLNHTELFDELEKRLGPIFSTNIYWFGETVKLDLEAREIIEIIGSRPEKLRLKRMKARR